MRRVLGSAAFVLITLVPIVAVAKEPLVLTASIDLKELNEYSEVIIENGGKLKVLNPAEGGTGRLHLRATRIWVKTGGSISADGAGRQGADGMNGGGVGGGQMPPMT